MGISLRPQTPDEDEFQKWKAAQSPPSFSNVQGGAATSPATHDDEEFQQWKAANSAAPRSTAYNAVNTVSNALTMGLGQKFNALYNATGDKITGRDSFTHSYGKNLEAEHAGLEKFRGEHPYGAAIASGITSGLSGAGIARLGLAGAGEIANGLSLAQRTGAAAKAGAAWGSVGALGNAPNTGGIVENAGRAAVGGGAGGLLGAAFAPATQLIGAGARRVVPSANAVANKVGGIFERTAAADHMSAPAATEVTPFAAGAAGGRPAAPVSTPEPDGATRLLLARLKRAGITPQDALDRLSKIPANKPVTVMEIAGETSHPVRQLGKLVARTPSAGAANLRAAMTERAEPLANAQRVLGDVGEAMGVERTNSVEHGQQMSGQRLAAAKPHYDLADEAQAVPIDMQVGDGPALKDLLRRPSVQSALSFHNDVALERGEKPIKIDKKTADVPFETLRQIKYKLDDILGFAKERGQLPDGTPATKAKLGAINDTRVALLDIMGAHEPAYANANEIWAGESALQNAGKTGRDFLSSPIDELQHDVGKMTAGEREQHNISALSGPLRDRLFKTNAVDRAKILSGPDIQERLQTVVPRERMPALRRNSGVEHQIALTHQSIGGGSDTAENMLNQFDASGSIPARGLATAFTQGPRRAAAQLFQNALESRIAARLQGVNEKTSNQLAPMLTAGVKSRDEAQALMETLAAIFDQAARRRGSLPYAGTAAGALTGQLATRQR